MTYPQTGNTRYSSFITFFDNLWTKATTPGCNYLEQHTFFGHATTILLGLYERGIMLTPWKVRITSCVSLLKVTHLLSLFLRMMCRNWRLGTSFIICHLIGKKPLYLSSFQNFMSFSKSTGPSISATPTNWPLALTWFDNKVHPRSVNIQEIKIWGHEPLVLICKSADT